MGIRVNLRLSQQTFFYIQNVGVCCHTTETYRKVSMVLNITLTGREPEVTSITSRPMICGCNEYQEGNSWRSVA